MVEFFINGFSVPVINFDIAFNIYEPESNFNLEIMYDQQIHGNGLGLYPGSIIGAEFTLFIDKKKYFTGIIETTRISYNKTNITRQISGRNYIGLLNKNYVEIFQSFKGKTLEYLANWCIQKVPYVNKKCKIKFNCSNDIANNCTSDPGESYFSLLKKACVSRGVIFYVDETNTLVFDKPKVTPEKSIYNFKINEKENFSNVLNCSYFYDSQNWYSKVKIIGQDEVNDQPSDYEGETIYQKDFNFKYEKTDNLAPVESTIVINHNNKGILAEEATQFIDQQRFNGKRLEYTVPGFSLDGNNIQLNKTVYVDDNIINVHHNYLVYAFNMTYNKSEGEKTNIKLANV